MISYITNSIKQHMPLSYILFKNKSEIISLGRWGVVSQKGKNINTDNANEDHCGPCGTYDVKKKYEDIERNINYYKNKSKKNNI